MGNSDPTVGVHSIRSKSLVAKVHIQGRFGTLEVCVQDSAHGSAGSASTQSCGCKGMFGSVRVESQPKGVAIPGNLIPWQ